ncbi:MAG: DUF917 domain-containing protein [Nitrososphaerales archaeon]
MSRKLSREEIEALILGASIYSTGGGGSVQDGMNILEQISNEGLQATLISLQELKDDALVFNPAEVGGGVRKELEKRFEQRYGTKIPLKWERWPVEKWIPQAVKELQKHLGRRPDAYIATELGPGALLRPLYQAAKEDLPVVDGDPVGRSVPEMTMSLFNLNGFQPALSVATSHFGDVIVIKRASDYKRLEDILRSFAEYSGGGVGFAKALQGREVKKALLPESYTRCIKLGLAIKEATRNNKDLIKTILDITGGYLLFRGRLLKLDLKPAFGHLIGAAYMEGIEEYRGKKFKLWFKNENHAAWRNGRICALSPDIITVLDEETGTGIYNFDWVKISKERKLAAIGIPAPEVWRTKEGLKILGPRAVGVDADYKPIESLELEQKG